MKKFNLYILLITCSLSLKALEPPLLWKLFQQSSSSSESANKLYDISKNFTVDNKPLLIGYRGISNLMLCNYVISPINKLSHFKEGKKLLELAIKNDSICPELRFFRFSVQFKTPAFLGYKANLKQDKNFLIKYLTSNNAQLKQEAVYNTILNFLLTENYCTEEEKKILLNLSK